MVNKPSENTSFIRLKREFIMFISQIYAYLLCMKMWTLEKHDSIKKLNSSDNTVEECAV